VIAGRVASSGRVCPEDGAITALIGVVGMLMPVPKIKNCLVTGEGSSGTTGLYIGRMVGGSGR